MNGQHVYDRIDRLADRIATQGEAIAQMSASLAAMTAQLARMSEQMGVLSQHAERLARIEADLDSMMDRHRGKRRPQDLALGAGGVSTAGLVAYVVGRLAGWW